MDYEGYSAWERHMVDVLTRDDGESAERALAVLETDLSAVQQWRPGPTPLSVRIEALRVASGLQVEPEAVGAGEFIASDEDTVVRRYLAARAFASWAAYDVDGIIAVLRSLSATLAVLRSQQTRLPLKEAIRQTDLQLVHLRPELCSSERGDIDNGCAERARPHQR
jgi:hypothetical protein